ncbi:hypothetical protein H0W91_04305 [Patescibacteria group bacterium]|nr:hypothetical protein [Patescibacteria group bacterium]
MRPMLLVLLLLTVSCVACGTSPASPDIYLGEFRVSPAIVEIHLGMSANFKASGGNGVYNWTLEVGKQEFFTHTADEAHYFITTLEIFRIRVETKINGQIQTRYLQSLPN